jgi:3-methyladenine DNA glycosylase AlkC
MAVFQYMPHVFFVAEHGVDDFEHAMRANYELTKRFSAEFSVRPFLERYPREAFAKLRLWARDPNVHVRRLVSEGSRPRLPWAPRLRSLEVDPRPGLALLELLKDDPERYVQRSVANHLNDVAKVHADLVVSVCEDWMASPSEARRWIVERALRTLIKRGHPRALALLGARNAPGAWRVEDASILPSRVTISGSATLSATLVNASASTRTAIVDFEIHYPGSRPGTDRRKVFKLTRVKLEPRARARLSKRISFTPRSTRAIYPGMHAVELRVNGTAFPVGRVRVARPKAPAPHTRTRRAR